MFLVRLFSLILYEKVYRAGIARSGHLRPLEWPHTLGMCLEQAPCVLVFPVEDGKRRLSSSALYGKHRMCSFAWWRTTQVVASGCAIENQNGTICDLNETLFQKAKTVPSCSLYTVPNI